jgi:phage shock protein A
MQFNIEELNKLINEAVTEIQQLRDEIAFLSEENKELMKERNYLKATIHGLEKRIEGLTNDRQ